MPEMHFAARWPDGAVVTYYSPSLVIGDYLIAGASYTLDDFLGRSRTALQIASERVFAKYGYACPRAAATLGAIEAKAAEFAALPDAAVRIETQEE